MNMAAVVTRSIDGKDTILSRFNLLILGILPRAGKSRGSAIHDFAAFYARFTSRRRTSLITSLSKSCKPW